MASTTINPEPFLWNMSPAKIDKTGLRHYRLSESHTALTAYIEDVFDHVITPSLLGDLSFDTTKGWQYHQQLQAWEYTSEDKRADRIYIFAQRFHVYIQTASAHTFFVNEDLSSVPAVDCTQKTPWEQWTDYTMTNMVTGSSQRRDLETVLKVALQMKELNASKMPLSLLDYPLPRSQMKGIQYLIGYSVNEPDKFFEAACYTKISQIVRDSLQYVDCNNKIVDWKHTIRAKSSLSDQQARLVGLMPASLCKIAPHPPGELPSKMPLTLLLLGGRAPTRASLIEEWHQLSKEWDRYKGDLPAPHTDVYQLCKTNADHLIKGKIPALHSNTAVVLDHAIKVRSYLDQVCKSKDPRSDHDYAIVGVMDTWLRLVDHLVMAWSQSQPELFLLTATHDQSLLLCASLRSLGISVDSPTDDRMLDWHRLSLQHGLSGYIAEGFRKDVILRFIQIHDAMEIQSTPANISLAYLFPQSMEMGLAALFRQYHALDPDGPKTKFYQEAHAQFIDQYDRYHTILGEMMNAGGKINLPEDKIQRAILAASIFYKLRFHVPSILALWGILRSQSRADVTSPPIRDHLDPTWTRETLLQCWATLTKEWDRSLHLISEQGAEFYKGCKPHMSCVQNPTSTLAMEHYKLMEHAAQGRQLLEKLHAQPSLTVQDFFLVGLLDTWLRLVDAVVSPLFEGLNSGIKEEEWPLLQAVFNDLQWTQAVSKDWKDWHLPQGLQTQEPGLISTKAFTVLTYLIVLNKTVTNMSTANSIITRAKTEETLGSNPKITGELFDYMNSWLAGLAQYNYIGPETYQKWIEDEDKKLMQHGSKEGERTDDFEIINVDIEESVIPQQYQEERQPQDGSESINSQGVPVPELSSPTPSQPSLISATNPGEDANILEEWEEVELDELATQ